MIVIFHFEYELNVSLQPGDFIYYVPFVGNSSITTNSAQIGLNSPINSNTGTHKELGVVQEIGFGQNDTVNQASSFFTTLGFVGEPVQWISVEITNQFNLLNIPLMGGLGGVVHLFFGKNNSVNMSSLSGYYAIAKFMNNSTGKAELFSIGSEITQSSK